MPSTSQRFWTVLFFNLILGSQALAAGFDCRAAKKGLEIAICADPKLGLADEKLNAAYRSAIGAVQGEWKEEIVRSQRKWLASLDKDYNERPAGESPIAWLRKELLARQKQLKETAEREKIVLLQQTPEAKEVCSKALSKSNMTWNGRSEYGQDDFTLELPPEFTSPVWESPVAFVDQSRLDFLNEGRKSDVYRISYEDSHVRYTCYIVARPNEKSEIERRLQQADGFSALPNDLTVDILATDAAAKNHPKPKLASRLIQTSETELYDGWYTRSTVAQYKGKTYIIAESVNNLQGPTFTVFRPRQPGKLIAQCYFRATPSLVVESRKQLAQAYRCPADLKPIKTELDRDPCGTSSARIDLKEWGGKRMVIQEGTVLARNVCGISTIMVGAVGQEKVEKNSWSPIDEVLDGQGWFHLTEAGPYAVSEQKSGELYYRIAENTLKPVCQTSRRMIEPSGYRRNPLAD